MTKNELMVVGEYERLRSQIATLENDEEFPNRKSQIVMPDEDCGIAKFDTFKTVYHFGTSLKDLGKKMVRLLKNGYRSG